MKTRFKLIRESNPLTLSPDEVRSAITNAERIGYLKLAEDGGALALPYIADRQSLSLPAVILQKRPRWYEVRAYAFGDRLKDEARDELFELCITASLPGGSVYASNLRLLMSRCPYAMGAELVDVIAARLSDGRSVRPGPCREYAGWKGMKRVDGTIWIQSYGIGRRAA